MPIRAVLFDVGHTLWHDAAAPSREEFERVGDLRAREFLAHAGLVHPDPGTLQRAAWSAVEQAIERAQTTDLVEPDLPGVAANALRCHGLAVDQATAAAFLEAIYLSGAEGGKRAYPDARDTLLELKRRRFLLATVTNRGFGGKRFRDDLAELGLDVGWDAHVVSSEVGRMKPHVTPFLRALADLGVAPEEALMVGDSLAQDIAGAQRLGITTAWNGRRADAEGVTPDYTFTHLVELLDLQALREALR